MLYIIVFIFEKALVFKLSSNFGIVSVPMIFHIFVFPKCSFLKFCHVCTVICCFVHQKNVIVFLSKS